MLKAEIGGADANGTAEPADLDTAVPDHSADLSLADLARFRRLSYSKKTGAVRRGSKPIFGSRARRPAKWHCRGPAGEIRCLPIERERRRSADL